jgi:hypothetical protein
LAGTLTLDAGAGVYGTPYGYLGPQGTRVWEVYRKNVDTFPTPWPSVTGADEDGGRVLFSGLREGEAATDGTFKTFKAVFAVGTAVAEASYPEARWALGGIQSSEPDHSIGLRVGFAEHLAAGAGAPFSAFIAAEGPDDHGNMDPYYGNWGVDGLYFFFAIDGATGTWVVTPQEAALVAASSGVIEGPTSLDGGPIRANHLAEVGVTGGTLVASGTYDTGVVSTVPLSLAWQVSGPTNATLTATLGGTMQVTWLFDDGVTRHGLTDPANPDAVGYQNGSLDLTRMVPIVFTHWGAYNGADIQPVASLEVVMSGQPPRIANLPAWAPVGSKVSFDVVVDPASLQTVTFSSSDPSSTPPPAYTFQSGDLGVHSFEIAFSTVGSMTLTVADEAVPALSSSVQVQVLQPRHYGTACSCDASAGLAGLLALAVRVRRRRPRFA